MVDSNSYDEDNKRVKICENNCGKLIYWNHGQKTYFEIDSQQKHVCHNRESSLNNSQKQFSQYGVNLVNTTEQIMAKILLMLDRINRKLDKLGGS
jgi:hypothetical protein